MEKLYEISRKKILGVPTDMIRGIISDINWNARLIGIKGARGVGKTTLILQYIKLHLSMNLNSVLYISLDNIWFSENRLVDLADYFVKRGGKYLFIDEAHKYRDWSIELKNIYDDFPELHVVFTGSSLLEIINARADLSRRAVIYTMQGLSYREYLNIELGTEFESYELSDILSKHEKLSHDITSKIRPLKYFSEYLQKGYYPFYKEQPDLYHSRLEEVLNMILYIELPLLRNIDIAYVIKLKQLLLIISESAPFTPNITRLSERIGLNRQTMLQYLYYLNEAHLTYSVYKEAYGISILQKPAKLFMENTNLMYALQSSSVNTGNTRETFFANQLRYKYRLTSAPKADFIINRDIVVEIGGKRKNDQQIRKEKNAFLAIDDIEYGYRNRIPLWLFGFLY